MAQLSARVSTPAAHGQGFCKEGAHACRATWRALRVSMRVCCRRGCGGLTAARITAAITAPSVSFAPRLLKQNILHIT